jgi:hypothetical protein
MVLSYRSESKELPLLLRSRPRQTQRRLLGAVTSWMMWISRLDGWSGVQGMVAFPRVLGS